MKKRKELRKLAAQVLIVAMLAVQLPTAAVADVTNGGGWESKEEIESLDENIKSFKTLSRRVREQYVLIDTPFDELNLPETVRADVYKVKSVELIINEDEDPHEDATGSNATGSNATGSNATPSNDKKYPKEIIIGTTCYTISTIIKDIPVSWNIDKEYDETIENDYVFTAEVEGYDMAEDVTLPQIKIHVVEKLPISDMLRTGAMPPRNVASPSIAGLKTSYDYKGNPIECDISLKGALGPDSVEYRSSDTSVAEVRANDTQNENAPEEAIVKIIGPGTFKIQALLDGSTIIESNEVKVKLDISGADITLKNETFYWTGNPIEPEIDSVIAYGISVPSTAYDISYTDNIESGTGKIEIKALKEPGSDSVYEGTASTTFTITRRSNNNDDDDSSGTTTASAVDTLHGMWTQNIFGKWRFRLYDGQYATNMWGIIGGRWYRFDENAAMVTGWYYDDFYQGWFFMNEKTGEMITGWLTDEEKWYYLNPVSDGNQGILVVDGWTVDGYWVDANGVWDGRPADPAHVSVGTGVVNGSAVIDAVAAVEAVAVVDAVAR